MTFVNIVVVAAAATLLTGCSSGSNANAEGLQDGVYRFELTEAYLLENGIPAEQARKESGVHEITIDRGAFIDRWRTEEGSAGSCLGTYSEDGARVTFRWNSGCAGDWAMSYSVDGDVVTWSDFEPLDPNAGPEERKVTEIFNGVAWMLVGDVPDGAQR
jgi:hypothetical protein